MLFLLGVVTRDAARLGKIVAVGTGDGHVPGNIRRTGTARGYNAKLARLHACGIENACIGKGGCSDFVAGVRMTLDAGLIAAMRLVIEVGDGALDRAVMACDAAAVGHVGDRPRELRVGREVVVDLLERHELVADLGFQARIDVARHAIDARMRALVPGDVVRIHLVTRRTERRFARVCSPCDSAYNEHSQCAHEEGDAEHGPSLSGSNQALHRGVCSVCRGQVCSR